MSMENDIVKVLEKHSKGLRRSEISKLTGYDKSAVSSYMHNNKGKFFQDGNYYWHLKQGDNNSPTSSFKNDPVLCKLENQEAAKTFTLAYFNSLADWSQSRSQRSDGAAGVHYTKEGKRFEFDSNYEAVFLDYIKDNDLAIAYGTQAMCVKYDTFFRANVDFYPDIVLLTKDYHIAIVEIKPCKFMSHHINIEKYIHLMRYCEENGYMYMMIDPINDFMTFEEFRWMDVDEALFGAFEDLKKEYGFFDDPKKDLNITDTMVEEWYEGFGADYTKEEFNLMVHSMIAYHFLYSKNKYRFDVYNYPKK